MIFYEHHNYITLTIVLLDFMREKLQWEFRTDHCFSLFLSFSFARIKSKSFVRSKYLIYLSSSTFVGPSVPDYVVLWSVILSATTLLFTLIINRSLFPGASDFTHINHQFMLPFLYIMLLNCINFSLISYNNEYINLKCIDHHLHQADQ